MDSKIALVTGGTGGLGTAICKSLFNQGYKVITTAVPWLDYHEWLSAAAKDGYEFHVMTCDVSNYGSCESMYYNLVEAIGDNISVLVNNAGITRDAPLKRMEPGEWDAVIRTNLDSMYNMSSLVLNGMIERNWGRIINISSVNGIRGQYGQTNYSAAKAGVLGFTKALAQEVAKNNITVNAIAPGYIATDMVKAIKQDILEKIESTIPVGRLGTPEEIAHTVEFLVSPLSGYMTGATLNVNGGLHFC